MNKKPLLSIIIPVYFNAPSLKKLHTKIAKATSLLDCNYECIYVNDGSKDDSLSILKQIKKKDSHVKIVDLSRNFGSFNAILAGMSIAKGDAIMDLTADLQDDPQLIIRLFEQWQKGFSVCLAIREQRQDGWLSNTASNTFYRLMQRYALPDMPKGGFDIFLIDRIVVNLILSMEEKNTSLIGQILWLGFKRKCIYYSRKQRPHGRSRWTLSKKLKYFIDSFLAFSYTPIRLMTSLGLLTAGISAIYMLIILGNWFFNQIPVAGWSSLAILILFLGSIQMIMLGIIGEYVWRSLEASKKRPNFVIEKIYH